MAPIGRRSAEIVLRYNLDRAELNRALASVDDAKTNISELRREFSDTREASLTAASAITDVGYAARRLQTGDVFGAVQQTARTATEIAGLGVSIETLAGIAIPTAVAVGAVSVALTALKEQTEEYRRGLELAYATQDRYYELVQEGTSESIRAELEELEVRRQSIQERLEGAQTELDRLVTVRESGERFRAGIAAIGGATEDVRARVEDLESQLGDTQSAIDAHRQALESDAIALNDATAAQEALTEARIKEIQQQGQIEQSIARLSRTGTSEQLDARLEAIDIERQAIQGQLSELAQLDKTSEDVQEATAGLNNRLSDLEQEERALETSARKLIDAREAEQRQIDQLKEAAAAVEDYNEDVAAIEQKWREERLRLAKRFSDDQIRIARNAAEAARKALEDLEQEREDLRRNLGRDLAQDEIDLQRDELDARIDFMRDEEQAAREHYDNLLDIRQRAQAQETELALRRDFAGINRLRRETGQRLSEENREFGRQRRERLIALREEREDLQRHFLEQREDRLKRFEQDLDDAQDQYRRELRAIEQKRQRELQLLVTTYRAEIQGLVYKYQAELSLRAQAITQELQLIQQGYQARLALEAFYQNQLIQQAQAILGSAASSFAASTKAPKTATVNNTYHIQGGADPNKIAALVDKKTKATLKQVFAG